MSRDAQVVVVGGGIAGLATAWELQRRGHSALVLERDARPGGRIRTERWHGARIELGVHFLTPAYRRVMEIARDVGLTTTLVDVADASRLAVRRDGRWHHMDALRAGDFLSFSALGVREKLALTSALLPRLLPPWPDLGDVATVASLDRGTLSDRLPATPLDSVLAPVLELLLGYPREDQSYALLAALLPPRGRLRTLPGGMEDLVRSLAARCEVECGVAVERVEQRDGGVVVRARTPEGDRTYEARAAVLAVRAREMLDVWPEAPDAVRRFASTVRYSSHQLLYLRTRSPLQPRNPRGRGIYAELIGGAERGSGSLAGLGFLDAWASEGGLVLAGAAPGSPATLHDDDGFAAALEAEVVALHPDLRGQVTARRPLRGGPYVPVFGPGTAAALSKFRSDFATGAIALAGDYLGSPCMEGAVGSAHRAVETIVPQLSRHTEAGAAWSRPRALPA